MKSPESQERFFYHSFPRPRVGVPSQLAKGLGILESMCKNGLLLVPEQVSWHDPTGTKPEHRTFAIQRRISFTELAPIELVGHAAAFGPFALEYKVATLRSLGALPVIYVPDSSKEPTGFEWSGISLLARVSDALQIIAGLAGTERLTAPTIDMRLTQIDGTRQERRFDEVETQAIRDYLALLRGAPGQPLAEIEGALCALASLFYPTENLSYAGPLAYYRQREWRLVSGGYLAGQPTTVVTSTEQQAELLALDSEFFSRTLPFPSGEASLAEKSHYLATVRGQHPLMLATRLIAPSSELKRARALIDDWRLAVTVVALEDVGHAT